MTNEKSIGNTANIKSIKQIYCERVAQLDTKLLDNDLFSTIESKLSEIQIQKLKDLRPELSALIKAYIWLNSINRSGISIGQSLLRLKYYDLSENNWIKHNLTTNQNLCFVLTQILFPWIKERINYTIRSENIKNGLEFVENTYKTIDLINCFLFLYYGKYGSLWERVCKLGIGFQSISQKTSSSELYLEIMNRELLWNSFSEFFTFVLPLINFYRIRNTFNYYLRTFLFPPSLQIDSNVEQRIENDLKLCSVCNQWPTDGHEIGCRHVFCYYCLMSNFMSDPTNGLSCNQCFYKITSIESIKRVKISIF